MSETLLAQLENVPGLLAAHVQLTFLALILGVSVSLPLGLYAAYRPRTSRVVLGVSSVLQTIPSLALLALSVALLASFGFWPALLALFIYSTLPVLRNTVTGIRGLDADVLEAATALGMTPFERLVRVEVPLAAPVIVAGVRTAAVWVVGSATLSTPVGQPSLGNFIFSGLQTRNFTAVVVGCVTAAALSLAIDALLGGIERALAGRRPKSALAWAGALAVGLAASLAAPSFSHRAQVGTRVAPRTATPETRPNVGAPTRPVRVGSKAFTEQYVLAAAMATLLGRRGFAVDARESLGSTIAFDALRNDELDVYVDYTGTLWSNVLGRQGSAEPWRVLAEVTGELARRHAIRCLGPLGFENAYAFAMRADRAKELGVASLDDLVGASKSLSFGTDLEFLERPEWRSVQEAYRLEFARSVTFDPTFMYDAVVDRSVDVITAFSSDARIAAFDLVLLDDPRRALPPYDAVILLAPGVAANRRIVEALEPLIDAIDVRAMREANLLVDRATGKYTPERAAAWLLERIDERVLSPRRLP